MSLGVARRAVGLPFPMLADRRRISLLASVAFLPVLADPRPTALLASALPPPVLAAIADGAVALHFPMGARGADGAHCGVDAARRIRSLFVPRGRDATSGLGSSPDGKQ